MNENLLLEKSDAGTTKGVIFWPKYSYCDPSDTLSVGPSAVEIAKNAKPSRGIFD